MRVLLQRVKKGSVTLNKEKVIGSVEMGFVALVGFCEGDEEAIIKKVVDKMIHLRIFSDEKDKLNLSLLDINGEILSISQFTLYADCKKGRRPSFVNALEPTKASQLYEYFNLCIKEAGVHVETGQFGGDMLVEIMNDGPVTILLDSKEIC